MKYLRLLSAVVVAFLLAGCGTRNREITIELDRSRLRDVLQVVDRELSAVLREHPYGSSGGGGPAFDESFTRTFEWRDSNVSPLSITFQRRNTQRIGGNPYGLMISWRGSGDLASRPGHSQIASRLISSLKGECIMVGLLAIQNLDFIDGLVMEQK